MLNKLFNLKLISEYETWSQTDLDSRSSIVTSGLCKHTCAHQQNGYDDDNSNDDDSKFLEQL